MLFSRSVSLSQDILRFIFCGIFETCLPPLYCFFDGRRHPLGPVTGTHSIYSYSTLGLEPNELNGFFYSAIKLPVKLIRIFIHYCKIYKQLHGRILNMSLYNFPRKNEFRVHQHGPVLSNLKKECPPTHLSSVVLGRFLLSVLFQDFMQYYSRPCIIFKKVWCGT